MNHPAKSNQEPYPLHAAVIADDVEMFKKAVTLGHDINGRNEYGETPLITAVIEHNEDWVVRLLDLGADIDGTDKNGDTALDSAEYHRCEYLIDLLKERGATIRDGVSYQQKLTTTTWKHAAKYLVTSSMTGFFCTSLWVRLR